MCTRRAEEKNTFVSGFEQPWYREGAQQIYFWAGYNIGEDTLSKSQYTKDKCALYTPWKSEHNHALRATIYRGKIIIFISHKTENKIVTPSSRHRTFSRPNQQQEECHSISSIGEQANSTRNW